MLGIQINKRRVNIMKRYPSHIFYSDIAFKNTKLKGLIIFSVFESDIRIENVGRISLHNIDPSFIDLYAEHKSIIITGDTNTMMYDLEPGSTGIISIPDDLKAKSKTIFVSICYLFNENPLDRVDNFVSPIKLKNDPFYEYMRRVQAYHEIG